MQALHAAIALTEAVSVDSDTSRILEAAGDKPGHRRGRKQAKPLRSAFSSDTPSESQPQQQAAPKQQHGSHQMDCSSLGGSPVLNNQAGWPQAASTGGSSAARQLMSSSSNKGSKLSPAQRQGPCGHCKTPYSPQWRKGPRNKPVLCNACGIRYLRNRHLGRAVPQKKRVPCARASSAAGDSSAGEGSMDTMTDTTDMRGQSKKRRAKKALDMCDEDTSAYSYDTSSLQEMGSIGSFQQLFLQQHHQHTSYSYSDTDRHAVPDADATGGHRSDVSRAAPAAHGTQQLDAGSAGEAAEGAYGTSVPLMPGNMHSVLAPMHSASSSSGAYGGSFSMALALQLFQQQHQQQLMASQHMLLAQQASSDATALQAAGSVPGASTAAAAAASVLQTQGSSGAPAHASAGQLASAQASLLYSQSLHMQTALQGYLLQQQAQAAGMLHGPSPLSVMSSAGPSSGFSLGGAAAASGLASMLQCPTSMAAPPAVPSLEITPLVCGGGVPASTSMPAQALIAGAADLAPTLPATAGVMPSVAGSSQGMLAA